ncbi:MAG: response regulator, partial [Bacteroidota bacterium]
KNRTDLLNPPVANLSSLPRLLIVEDNIDLANYLMNSLSSHFHCTLAGNGQKALDLLNEQYFDIITSDVMMPEMDGFEFRRQVNKRENWQHIPFLMLTARALEEDKLLGFKLGIDDYVTKPFSIPELVARLNSLLKNKKGREEEWQNEPITSQAQQLLARIQSYVLNHLDDPSWGVEDIASDINCSQRHLARQIGPLTGMSPVQLILEIRLQEAYRMLKQGKFAAVSEVRYAVGIESASYFSRKFKERFGKTPSELS